jgi:hypothetical protein
MLESVLADTSLISDLVHIMPSDVWRNSSGEIVIIIKYLKISIYLSKETKIT